jgi:hypothetical protein
MQRSSSQKGSDGMSDDTPQEKLLDEMVRLFGRCRSGGDLAPLADHQQWDKLVDSKPSGERELLQELARFSDLWRYFQERNEKLGPEIVHAINCVHKVSVEERIERLKEINQKLMERIGGASEDAQFRH